MKIKSIEVIHEMKNLSDYHSGPECHFRYAPLPHYYIPHNHNCQHKLIIELDNGDFFLIDATFMEKKDIKRNNQ